MDDDVKVLKEEDIRKALESSLERFSGLEPPSKITYFAPSRKWAIRNLGQKIVTHPEESEYENIVYCDDLNSLKIIDVD